LNTCLCVLEIDLFHEPSERPELPDFHLFVLLQFLFNLFQRSACAGDHLMENPHGERDSVEYDAERRHAEEVSE
jgi:hypothetical protein